LATTAAAAATVVHTRAAVAVMALRQRVVGMVETGPLVRTGAAATFHHA
jgi:hypothetical protein